MAGGDGGCVCVVGGGACMAGEMVTAADDTRPTGMLIFTARGANEVGGR